MSRLRGVLALAGLILLVLAFAAAPPRPAAAQPSTAESDALGDVFLDTVEVNVVNLEVFVTDADGNPIQGLTRDDFVLLEDGKPMPLSNFYEVESARRVLPPDVQGGERRSGGESTELPPDQRLNLAVVIDNQNISPPNRKRAMDQIRGELERVVRPGDRVLVAVLDPLPTIEQLFTDDMDAVNAALDRIAHSTSGNRSLAVQRVQILRELSQADGPDGPINLGGGGKTPDSVAQPADYANLALSRITGYVEQADYQMRRTFTGIQALVASLGGLPARKAVLYVSDGLDTNPALGLYTAFFDSYPDEAPGLGISSPASAARRYDLSDDLRDVTRTASGNRVTFYTLDSYGSRAAAAGPEYSGITPLAANVELSSQDTLLQLAAATGGTTMLNAANVRALLDDMAQDHSDYYSLGYVSPTSRDGQYHRLQVQVPGLPKAKVRHTEGYLGKRLIDEMADRTLSALVLDVADNPLNVRIELGEEKRESKDRFVLPVLVKIPIAGLALVPQESAHRGMLTIFLAVRDDAGGLSQPQHFEVPVDIPNAQLLNAMSREVGYGVNLLVRRGGGKLAVGVRDEIAAVESTVNLDLSIGG